MCKNYFVILQLYQAKKYSNRKRDDLRGWRKFFSIEKKFVALYYFDEKMASGLDTLGFDITCMIYRYKVITGGKRGQFSVK